MLNLLGLAAQATILSVHHLSFGARPGAAATVRNASAAALVSVALLLMGTVAVTQTARRAVSILTEFLYIAARVTYLLIILAIAVGGLVELLLHG